MLKWKVGDVTVTRIVEMELPIPWSEDHAFLKEATPEVLKGMDWLFPHFCTPAGEVILSFHALLVETPTKRIVVDTCIGNDKPRTSSPAWNQMQTSFLQDFEAAGFARDSIDVVLCTHLHVDHVGWNTMLVDGRWVPTFPNARYLMGRSEFEYWRDQRDMADQVTVFADSVQPVFDAGLVDLVTTDHRVCDEISLVPTLGHTPGHVSVRISSNGEEALITGDFLHHPCQMAHMDWTSSADFDKNQSTRTRQEVFSRLAGTPTLLIGTHFAGATAGRVVRDGDAYRLVT